jgi:hypothetical protein
MDVERTGGFAEELEKRKIPKIGIRPSIPWPHFVSAQFLWISASFQAKSVQAGA